MKGLIKELLRESLLNERLMDVSEDVDNIYEKYFMADCEIMRDTGMLESDMFDRSEFSTSDLTSPLALKAHALNPCTILINVRNNFYNPNKNIISLGINKSATNFIKDNGYSLLKAQQRLINDGSQVDAKRLRGEFNYSRVKGSIHHELVHWIDDTLNNRHIRKAVDISSKKNSTIDSKGRARYLQPMEIQALIHNIVQLNREYKSTWDELSFEEMINSSASLSSTMGGFSQSQKAEWKKVMINRMNREGLLGKNMR